MTDPRSITVQDQAKLSINKVFQLVRSGIKHRLLRSMLTMSVILLAVAFFMVTLSENVIINAVSTGVNHEIDVERSSIRLLNHLYTRPNSFAFSRKLSDIHKDDAALAEIAACTGKPLKHVTDVALHAHWEQEYFTFFKHMSVGNRKMLIGNKKGREIFKHLNDDAIFADFQKNLEPLRALKLPTAENEFQGLIKNHATYMTNLTGLLKAWKENIEKLSEETAKLRGETPLNNWLCDASDDQLQQWLNLLKSHNFSTENIDLSIVKKDMLRMRARNEVNEALLTPELKKEWQATFKVKEPLKLMMNRLGSEEVTPLINKYSKRPYTSEQLKGIADNVAHNQHLSVLESDLRKHTVKKSGSILSGRQTFLLIISFMVCMVGIANAMLMAITERFREIATMKCLGATDSFILIQFMMEAAMQGVFGGVLGMVIGFILGILKTSVSYGLYPFYYFPLAALIICALVSLLIGIFLAVLASLYPSWAASRMAPMEAMRIE